MYLKRQNIPYFLIEHTPPAQTGLYFGVGIRPLRKRAL